MGTKLEKRTTRRNEMYTETTFENATHVVYNDGVKMTSARLNDEEYGRTCNNYQTGMVASVEFFLSINKARQIPAAFLAGYELGEGRHYITLWGA